MIIRNLITHRWKGKTTNNGVVDMKKEQKSCFLNVYFHNKGLEMINLPSILNRKRVLTAVPDFLQPYVPPMVCFTYTKTISGTILNYKDAVRGLDFNVHGY